MPWPPRAVTISAVSSIVSGRSFMPGLPELLVIGLVILLLFGNRLPGVMRSLGQGITEFKKGVQGIEEDKGDGTKNAK